MEAEKERTAEYGRSKVQEWITGCELVREGVLVGFTMFGRGICVTEENVDYEEAHIRNQFGELYPELLDI